MLPWTIQAGLCLLIILSRFVVPSLRPLSERSSRAFSRFMLYSVVVAALVVGLNALLMKSGDIVTVFLGFSFYQDGLFFGLKTASRLILLSFSILLFFVSTPLPVLIDYLQKRGLPSALVLVLLLTLHFLDQLPSKIHQIFLAQQARGAPVNAGVLARARALLSILSPLVLSSIVESIERGTALELRGFLSRPPIERQLEETDARFNLLTVSFNIFSLLIIAYSVYRWLSA
jgi:energy-coupling factor transport system permease protein